MTRFIIKLLMVLPMLLADILWASDKGSTFHTSTKALIPKNYDRVWNALKGSSQAGKPFNVLHIGDSHIKYGFVTAPIATALKRRYGQGIEVEHWGINGATFQTYGVQEEIERILAARPQLLIVSLGTNDSYTPRFSPEEMRANMQAFFSLLNKKMPQLPIVMTTPPPSYLAATRRTSTYTGRGNAKRRVYQSSKSYTFNKHTVSAARTMKYFAQTEGYTLIDLNALIGSESIAKQWLEWGWMHQDRVHYTIDGYTKQGELIAEILIDAVEGKVN